MGRLLFKNLEEVFWCLRETAWMPGWVVIASSLIDACCGIGRAVDRDDARVRFYGGGAWQQASRL
jgi:hypothetical protein